MVYETLFLIYVGFVVLRIGYNFFFESLWEHERIMKLDFYIPAGIFFVIWTGGLIMFYLRGLQKSLASKLSDASRSLAQIQVPRSLFEATQQRLEATQDRLSRLNRLKAEIKTEYDKQSPGTPTLGKFTSRS